MTGISSLATLHSSAVLTWVLQAPTTQPGGTRERPLSNAAVTPLAILMVPDVAVASLFLETVALSCQVGVPCSREIV